MKIRKKSICSSKESFTHPYHKESVYIENSTQFTEKGREKVGGRVFRTSAGGGRPCTWERSSVLR